MKNIVLGIHKPEAVEVKEVKRSIVAKGFGEVFESRKLNCWESAPTTELHERVRFEKEHYRQDAQALVATLLCRRSGSDDVSVRSTRTHWTLDARVEGRSRMLEEDAV